MAEDSGAARLFTGDELKAFRYKCSHKLAISLTVGTIYLLGVTAFFANKAMKNVGAQDKLQYFGLAAAGYVFLIGLVAMLIHRSQSLNFSRFLLGCVKFDNFGYMLEYVELRMPCPFSPRFLKYPVHLMILGKVLEHSEKPENVEVGHRMVAASADRDPELEPFRGAELAELMKYHETFLAAHPELLNEWRNAESFHGLMVHFILPVVIIVGILSFILKGCEPPELQEEKQTKSSAVENVQKPEEASAKAASTGEKREDAPAVEAGAQPVTAPESDPQA